MQLLEAAEECVRHAETSVTRNLGELKDTYIRSCKRMVEGWEYIKKVEEAEEVPLDEISHHQLAERWGLQHPVSQLPNPSDDPSLESLEGVGERLRCLKSTTTNEDRLRIFRTFIDTLRNKTLELIKHIQQSQLDTAQYTAPALAPIDMLQDFMNEKRAHIETSASDDDITRWSSRVDALVDKTDTEEGRWKSGEALRDKLEAEYAALSKSQQPPPELLSTQVSRHKWLTEQYYEIFDYTDKLLRALRAKGRMLQRLVESNNTYKARAQSTKEGALHNISTLWAGIEHVTRQCESDVASIDSRVSISRQEDTQQTAEYLKWKERSDAQLKINEDEQQKCWERLFAVEKDLCRLGQERKMVVRARVERVVEESKRRLSLKKLLARCEEHKQLLSNQVANGCLGFSLLEFIRDSIVLGADKGVTAQRKNSKHQLRDLKIEVQKKEFETYREMHHKIGDLIQRKQLYRERLERGMACSWQLATLYADTYKGLLEQIEDLKVMQRKAASDFEPTEHVLRGEGVVFVHPSAEEELDTLKEVRQQYAKEEAKALDNVESTRLEVALSHTTLSYAYLCGDENSIRACLADGQQVLQPTKAVNLSAAPNLLPDIDIKADLDAVIMGQAPSSVAAMVARRLHSLDPCHSPEPTPPPLPRGMKARKVHI